eukprot:UN29922
MGFDKEGHAIKNEDDEKGQWIWMPKDLDPVKAPVRRMDPSFGGVAELFGDPNAAIVADTGHSNAHTTQPSFGGVKDMFDSEDDDESNKRPEIKEKKRDPSFGGVADMFADDEHESEEEQEQDSSDRNDDIADVEENSYRGSATGKKKRDPSFSGVADLFGSQNDSSDEHRSSMESEIGPSRKNSK